MALRSKAGYTTRCTNAERVERDGVDPRTFNSVRPHPMHLPPPWLVITGGFLLGFTLVSIVIRLLARGAARTLRRRVAECLDPAEALQREDYRANYFGRESLGGRQLRGNGALVLTDQALEFQMLWPRRRFRVPLAEVTGISIVRSHCGKSVGRDLLKVTFQAGDREDSVAWFVPNALAWKEALDAELSRSGACGDDR
jgi:hypothetical protein